MSPTRAEIDECCAVATEPLRNRAGSRGERLVRLAERRGVVLPDHGRRILVGEHSSEPLEVVLPAGPDAPDRIRADGLCEQQDRRRAAVPEVF